MRKRCEWAEGTFHDYIRYHDEEWGVPVHDDQKHFEFLVLEIAQAGLSWSTVLKKRENFRKAFANFNPAEVATFDEKKILELLNNKGIIRNNYKIRAAVNNAKRFLEIQEKFGSFDDFIWTFVNYEPIINHWEQVDQIPATSDESDALSKNMKERGFKFIGSTVLYAHMQACGLVNDHCTYCFRHQELKQLPE